MSDIEVGDLSFAVLSGVAEQNNNNPVMKATTKALLALDTYQRPYVWRVGRGKDYSVIG